MQFGRKCPVGWHKYVTRTEESYSAHSQQTPRPCPSTYLLAALLRMFKVKSSIFESRIDFFKSLILVILFIFYVFRGYHIMGLQLCKFIVKFNVIFVRWIVTVNLSKYQLVNSDTRVLTRIF